MQTQQFDFFEEDNFFEEVIAKESIEDVEDFDPELIRSTVVSGTDWTTETIFRQIEKGNIILNPSFQRRDAWTPQRKSAFIESLLIGFPIPPIVLAESQEKRGNYIVIDGKQRLLSIRQFFSKSGDIEFPQLSLSNLKILKELDGNSYVSMSEDPLLSDYVPVFENQSIRTIVIKNWHKESVLFNIFHRLNTGSVPLSPQELRQALHPGDFVNFVNKASVESHALRSILNNKNPDFRMRDVELLVRYYAFRNFISMYSGSLKTFLDDTCKKLNAEWSDVESRVERQATEFEDAYVAVADVFGGDDCFRKWDGDRYVRRFNRAIFDIMMFYFADQRLAEAARANSEEVQLAFKKLCANDSDFVSAIERTTKSVDATFTRLDKWGRALAKVTKVRLPLPRLEDKRIRF